MTALLLLEIALLFLRSHGRNSFRPSFVAPRPGGRRGALDSPVWTSLANPWGGRLRARAKTVSTTVNGHPMGCTAAAVVFHRISSSRSPRREPVRPHGWQQTRNTRVNRHGPARPFGTVAIDDSPRSPDSPVHLAAPLTGAIDDSPRSPDSPNHLEAPWQQQPLTTTARGVGELRGDRGRAPMAPQPGTPPGCDPHRSRRRAGHRRDVAQRLVP
jgi:hypothetical protein